MRPFNITIGMFFVVVICALFVAIVNDFSNNFGKITQPSTSANSTLWDNLGNGFYSKVIPGTDITCYQYLNHYDGMYCEHAQ